MIAVIFGILSVGGPFTIGFLISRSKLETRIFIGLSYSILALFFTPALSEVFLGPVYLALPEYAPTEAELFQAALASGILVNIGILTGSFRDAMPGKFEFKGLEIPKRFVATLGIIWALGFVVQASGVLDPSPARKLVMVTNKISEMSDEERAHLDRVLLKAWTTEIGVMK